MRLLLLLGAAAAAAAAAAAEPSLAHINQCLAGAAQAAVAPGIAALKSQLFARGDSAVVSVLAFGDEPSGLEYWADLVGEALGARVDVDLRADVLAGRPALSQAKGAELQRAREEVSRTKKF
jgi:hypothetical protein